MKNFRIVAISDMHGKYKNLNIPNCDLLIVAGDESNYGTKSEIEDFADWLNEQEAAYIIWVPGNHSVEFEKHLPYSRNWALGKCPALNILIDETIEIEGIKIFGSSYTPWFHSWAFQGARSENEAILRNIPRMTTHWDKIESGTDIVISHGPPYKIQDMNLEGEHCGDYDLIAQLVDISPDLVFCGHIHEGYGTSSHEGTDVYNVSICDRYYNPINPVTIVDYEFDTSDEE